ncbi:MAG: methionyl-tRNA formyltransferase [Treponema sp.]|jgi:methionyl-tRNA formyltransferase|nr:methionyl-tRNA formyltransferase [Treponema sp.]
MRVLFAGSPEIAVPVLDTLCAMKEIKVAGVLTNPDSPKGRSGALLPTEVGIAAAGLLRERKADFQVLKPAKLDSGAREQVNALKCDLLISFAYGRIFGPKFLALFPLGGINIHPSLLPRYRGPSPIQAAILNRDGVTGISVQKIALQMDSGDILFQEKLQLTGSETTLALEKTMALKAAQIIGDVLVKIAAGEKFGEPQNQKEASYCSLVAREDALLDWKRGAREIEAEIRAYNPWPLSRTIHKGLELFILKAGLYKKGCELNGSPGEVLGIDKQDGILIQTGEGIVAVTELQYQAKKALFWKDFLNGARNFTGSVLG